MKALSIRQPWAWAILHAGKDVENRDWRTDYRGPVLIHAGKLCTEAEYDSCMAFMHTISLRHPFAAGLRIPRRETLSLGGIVGEAEIVDCVTRSNSPWFCGKYGFVLRNARPLPFQRCRGALGFFDPDATGRAEPKRRAAPAGQGRLI
jgi:hypothetical protein